MSLLMHHEIVSPILEHKCEVRCRFRHHYRSYQVDSAVAPWLNRRQKHAPGAMLNHLRRHLLHGLLV